MLAWGYVICAAVTTILFSFGNKMEMMNFLFVNDKSAEIFWIWGFIQIVALFAVYWTANVVVHMVSFHVSALFLAPFLMGIMNRILGAFGKESVVGNVSTIQFAGFWLVLAIYIALLYVLSLKWDKMFTKMRYTILVAAIYTVVFAGIVVWTCEYRMATIVVFFLFTVFAGMKWTMAVTDRETFNRYYAVRHAGCIMNLIGLMTWSVGYNNK